MMLTAREYLMREPLPLHEIQEAILDFCRGRDDAILFGAQAVNLYVESPRMSQDVDLLSPEPEHVASALRDALAQRFHAAIRVRTVKPGRAYRLYQVRQSASRHLADVRLAQFALTDTVTEEGIRYVGMPLLLALKVLAYSKRRMAPKGATDLADIRRLLLARTDLRSATGPVADALKHIGASPGAFRCWEELVREPLVTDDETDEGY